MPAQDLQAEIEAKALLAAQLSEENAALKRKQVPLVIADSRTQNLSRKAHSGCRAALLMNQC